MSLQLGHCMFSRLIVTLRETFITKPAIIGTRKCEIPILDTLISFEKLKDQKSMLAVFKLTLSNFLFTSPSHPFCRPTLNVVNWVQMEKAWMVLIVWRSNNTSPLYTYCPPPIFSFHCWQSTISWQLHWHRNNLIGKSNSTNWMVLLRWLHSLDRGVCRRKNLKEEESSAISERETFSNLAQI